MISASERVILRQALERGFVSTKELASSQIKVAIQLAARALLVAAGTEPDGSVVYRPTDLARGGAREWL